MNKIKALAKKVVRADGHVFRARSVTKKFVEGPLAESREEGKWYDVHIVKDCAAQPALSDKKYIDLEITDDKDCFISTKRKYPAIVIKDVDALYQHD